MFIPLAVVDCYFLVVVVSDEFGLWGFPAFFIGIQLLTLGYMQVARSAAQDPDAKESAPVHPEYMAATAM
jgi:hypothetical protein